MESRSEPSDVPLERILERASFFYLERGEGRRRRIFSFDKPIVSVTTIERASWVRIPHVGSTDTTDKTQGGMQIQQQNRPFSDFEKISTGAGSLRLPVDGQSRSRGQGPGEVPALGRDEGDAKGILCGR